MKDEHYDAYMENMRYTWELYFKSIHLVMILSGATIAVLANITLGSDNAPNITHKNLAMWSMIAAGVAGAIAMVWRFASQVLCEKQLYHPAPEYLDYFKQTDTWVAYSLQRPGLVRVCRWTADFCKGLSALAIVFSWGLALWFVSANSGPMGLFGG